MKALILCSILGAVLTFRMPPIPPEDAPTPPPPFWEDPEGYQPKSSRTLGHLSSDKPVYKPNDVAFFELFMVEALSKKPVFNFNTWYMP